MIDQGIIKLTLESRLPNIRLVGAAVHGLCLAAGCDLKTAGLMELGLVEALNNVVKHAYQNQPGHLFELEVRVDSGRLVFAITDSGLGLSEWKEPTLDFDPQDLSSLPEGGMGRLIINKVMDQVEYTPGKDRNILALTKKL